MEHDVLTGNKVHAAFGVQYILDSVVSELLKNKNRRFIYVESAFLWRWWQEQDADSQAAVVQLVQEGRLQLVHGGWCMSDEATPHYSMLIDQMTFGLKFLKDTFGECGIPKIAWQIDPFGHSTEVALQFADMGYDAVFFGRIDHEDYRQRVDTKTMEHIWRPDTSLGEVGELFTGILFNLYTAPNGFCFDTYCSDEPIMDNPKLHGYNVNERITDFMREVRFWAEAYKTNHVQITMGGDFNYIVASSWFKNMDKLIKYINSKFNDVNVLYSTPACYLKALHAENVTWPVKDNDDFFPYGSDEHTYWTGYFTSRPNLKNLVYRANNVLQAVKQLRVVLDTELEEEETLMNRAMGIAQHHDAVSGTEKQHVSDDYALYLSEGLDASEKIFSAAYKAFQLRVSTGCWPLKGLVYGKIQQLEIPGEVGELFTGILFNLYTAPNGFCFDTYCSDEPIMDNPKLHGYNVNERITDFMREVRFWAEAYKTNHVQITMGGDFNYIVASSWFKNMDKLIKYINSKFNDVNVLYSTPACYLKALHAENVTWPVKDNDDFFPYGSDEHTYWTGYFTSRPNLKNLVYRANNVLQAVKQLRVVLDTELEEEETLMNRAMGIAQHHDAVSGTEKQHVSDDYALYLSEGLDASEKIFSAAYKLDSRTRLQKSGVMFVGRDPKMGITPFISDAARKRK
ncbi:carbohydrate binding, partial [Homalodisca vitripennis]